MRQTTIVDGKLVIKDLFRGKKGNYSNGVASVHGGAVKVAKKEGVYALFSIQELEELLEFAKDPARQSHPQPHQEE
jgi:hypothetical protein